MMASEVSSGGAAGLVAAAVVGVDVGEGVAVGAGVGVGIGVAVGCGVGVGRGVAVGNGDGSGGLLSAGGSQAMSSRDSAVSMTNRCNRMVTSYLDGRTG